MCRVDSHESGRGVPSEADKAQWLLDTRVLDVPRLLDVAALYGPTNPELTRRLLAAAFALQPLLRDELQAMVEGPIHDEEMERAVNQVEAGQLFSMQSPSNRGFLLGWNEAMGDLSYADAVVENLKSLTKEELQAAAARTFLREKSGSGILIPQSMQAAEEA